MRTHNRLQTTTRTALALALGLALTSVAHADSRTQAKRIHDRLAGVPPSATVLDDMENDIDGVGGKTAIDAAYAAMDNPEFYRVTLKNFVTPWTNEDQTVFAPLNDYTATVIGMIRDDVDFRKVLYDDILYTANTGLVADAYSNSDNKHYEDIEDQRLDLSDDSKLIATTQSAVTGLPAAATAGVMTTRAAARAYFVGGTNRAMFRFTMMNHMCNDLEQVKDTSGVPDRIRQDVSRSPGGDSRIFMNACVGCHAGMDPLAQAFAYYEWSYPDNGNESDYDLGHLEFTDGVVQPKYHINDKTFEFGYRTPDDHWDNYWRTGQNSALGWDTNGLGLPGSGDGAKSMGMELANSEAFAQCQVKKVFKAVCLRDPVDAADRSRITSMVTDFKTNGYKMKQVFAESAVYCMGD